MTLRRSADASTGNPVAVSSLRKHVLHAGLAVIALVVLFSVSQVAQLVGIAATIHPALGLVVAVGLAGGAGWLVRVPLVGYLRLDPALVPPAEAAGPEHDAFVEAYLEILRRNPRLTDQRLITREDLDTALKRLERDAEAVAKLTASRVFLSTAISQHGSLAALIVAVTQARMVWEIGHVFHQRPSPRQLGYLYANVLLTAFVATQVSTINLSDYLRPVLATALGQAMVAVPGVTAASGLVSNGLFRGSVNAFLTLRVAMVAIAYSRATVRTERNVILGGAVVRAGNLVVRTVTAGSAVVTKAFLVAATKTAVSGVTAFGRAVVAGATTIERGVNAGATAVGKGFSTASQSVVAGRSAVGCTLMRGAKEAGRATAELRVRARNGIRNIPDSHAERARQSRRAASAYPSTLQRVAGFGGLGRRQRA